MMWKIQQAMQDDAIRTARIHPAVHPGNRDEVFIWQNFQPAYRDLGNRASPPYHMNALKILQRIKGHVHTYPEIFLSANIFLRMRKFSRPHAAYSNRFQPSTRIRLYPEIF